MQPARKPHRLRGYDYATAGCYFVTICTRDRRNEFWTTEQPVPDAVGARIVRQSLTQAGGLVRQAIENIPRIYPSVASAS